MIRSLKNWFVVVTAACLAIAVAAPAFPATSGSAVTTYPKNWNDPAAWESGIPNGGGDNAFLGKNTAYTANVNGVIVNVTTPVSTNITQVDNDAILNIAASTLFTAGELNSRGSGQINISNTANASHLALRQNGKMNLSAGGTINTSGYFRLGAGAGDNTLFTMTGGIFNYTGADFAIAEGGGVDTFNQSGGLVKIAGDMDWNRFGSPSPTAVWNLSGGQLAVTGDDPGGNDFYVKSTTGTPGGIVLSGTGELYVRGNQVSDLSLIDNLGHVMLHGAVNASFGNWTLSDSTGLTGYTKFTAAAAPVPEPSTYALGLIGLAGLGLLAWRKRSAQR